MARYNIYAGMGGSMGGASYCGTEEFETHEDALAYAREQAQEEYTSYEGLYWIRSWQEIADDFCESNGISELSDEDRDTISEMYEEEVDGWIVYAAVLEEEDPDHDKEFDE